MISVFEDFHFFFISLISWTHATCSSIKQVKETDGVDDRVRDVVIFNLKAYSGVNDAKVSDMPAVCDCVFECVCVRERERRPNKA